MKNGISRRIIASLMLSIFVATNMMTFVFAKEDYNFINNYELDKPEIRGEKDSNKEEVLKLKADISITKSTEPISLSLRNSDVTQVLRMFADKAGLNIIFEEGVGGNVTMDLVDVPLNSAFDLVLEVTNLNYTIDGKTLIISKAGSTSNIAKQEMTVIPIKYVDANALATFLNKNIYGMKKPGMAGAEIAVTNPSTNEILIFGSKNDVAIARKVVEKFDKKPQITSFKVNHTTPSEMANMICNLLLPTTGAGSGGKTGGAAGIVTGGAASTEGLTLGGATVACSLNTTVDAGDLSSLPIQALAVSYYTELGEISILGGSESQLDMIKEFVQLNDKKQPQAYLELSIIELNETGSKTLDNAWQIWSRFFSANFANGTTSTNAQHPTFLSGSRYPVYSDDGDGTVDHYVNKYRGPFVLTYTIRYILENRKGRTVANPRILITNGKTSTIDLTSDYVKSVTSQVVQGSLNSTVAREYEVADDNGIKIEITPFISPDGYVTMDIKPEYSTIREQIYTYVETEDGEEPVQDLAATLLQRRNLDLKSVRIKDGETLVIGGMIREEDSKQVNKVPILGDIPYIGSLFRSSNTSKSKEEMVIMITPRIIVDNDDVKNNETTL